MRFIRDTNILNNERRVQSSLGFADHAMDTDVIRML